MKNKTIAEPRIYVAYGSNLDLTQMAHRCPGACPIGTGVINNYQLMFKGSKTGSYATIEPAGGYTVPVLLWAISASNENSLDLYEGCPTFYYKRNIAIDNFIPLKDYPTLQISSGMVYIMHEDRKFGIPSLQYYNVLNEGYKLFEFDQHILRDAYQFSCEKTAEGHEDFEEVYTWIKQPLPKNKSQK